MNKMERMQALFNGERVDYVPHSYWYHFKPEETFGEAGAQAHLKFMRDTDCDFLKIMDDNTFQFNLPLRHPSDWSAIKVTDKKEPYFQKQLDLVKRIVEIGKRENVMVYQTFFAPWVQAQYGISPDINDNLKKLTYHCKSHHPAVDDALKRIEESVLIHLREYFDAGIDGIYYACWGGSKDRFNLEDFNRYVKAHDLPVLQYANTRSKNNILHICHTYVYMEEYADYPCRGVNWDSHFNHCTIKEGKKRFPGKIIMGGLSNVGALTYGTPAEVEKECRELIETVGRENLIVGADCSLPFSPMENLRAVARVCKEY